MITLGTVSQTHLSAETSPPPW